MIAPSYQLENRSELEAALRDLRGFWKLWSACLLRSVELPTLRGVIVTRHYPEIDSDLSSFLKRIPTTTALIRHDIRRETPPYPRGGFLVRNRLLSEVLEFFFEQKRIVAVYEPADPLLNGHNINYLFENATDVWIEIVGPGFDASDLQRGDSSPHEVFTASLTTSGSVERLDLRSRVSQQDYELSIRERMKKIRRKLDTAPIPALARTIHTDMGYSQDLTVHLEEINSPLIEAQTYVPIRRALVSKTIAAIVGSGVIERFFEGSGSGFPLNFSTSMINRGTRQVFWDIVSPALKFEGLRV